MASEEDYPYQMHDGKCRTDVKPTIVVEDFVMVQPQSADSLMASIEWAPTAVSIDASSYIWKHYWGGIINTK